MKENTDSTKDIDKLKWEMPKLMDLDINENTETSGAGPSTFDGGAFTNDYNT